MKKKKIVSRLSAAALAGIMGTTALLPALSASAATLNAETRWKVTIKDSKNGYLYADETYGIAGERLRLNGSEPDNIVQFDVGESNWALCLRPSVFGGTGYNTQQMTTTYWKNLDNDLKTAIARVMYYGYPYACGGGKNDAQKAGYYNATQMIIWEMVLGYRSWDGTMQRRTNGINLCTEVYNVARGSYTWNAYREINGKLKEHFEPMEEAATTAKNAAKSPNILMTYDFQYNEANGTGGYTGNFEIKSSYNTAEKKWTANSILALRALTEQWSAADYNGMDVKASDTHTAGKNSDNTDVGGALITLRSNYKPFGNGVQVTNKIEANFKQYDWTQNWIVYAVSNNNQDMVTKAVEPDPAYDYLSVAVPNYGNALLVKEFENDGTAVDEATAVEYAKGVSFTIKTTDKGKDYYVVAHKVTEGDYAGSWQFDNTTTNPSAATKITLNTSSYSTTSGFNKTYIFDLPAEVGGREYVFSEYVNPNSKLAQDGYAAFGSGDIETNDETVKVNGYNASDPTTGPANVTVSFTDTKKSEYTDIYLKKYVRNIDTGEETSGSGEFIPFIYKSGKIYYLKNLIKRFDGVYSIPDTAVENGDFVMSGSDSALTTNIAAAGRYDANATGGVGLHIYKVPIGYKFGFIETKSAMKGIFPANGYGDDIKVRVNMSNFASMAKAVSGEVDGVLVMDTEPDYSGISVSGEKPIKQGCEYVFTYGVTSISGSSKSESLVNEPYHVSVKIKKVDPDGNALSDAVIGLYKDGEEIERHTTGSDGTIVFDHAFDFTVYKSDGYTYKEIEAPNGYAMDESEYNIAFTVAPMQYLNGNYGSVYSNLTTLENFTEIVNTPYKGEIHLKKTDENGNVMSGITFDFETNNDISAEDLAKIKVLNGVDANIKTTDVKAGEVFMTLTTDENGLIDVTGLPLGSLSDGYFANEFTAVETNVPEGLKTNGSVVYIFSDEDYDKDNDTYSGGAIVYESIDVTNSPVLVPIEIQKTDNHGNNLANVTFDVVAAEDVVINGETRQSKGEVVGTLTTDANGYAANYEIVGERADTVYKFKIYGGFKYSIVEKSVPTGIVLDPTAAEFTAPYSPDGDVEEFTYNKVNRWAIGKARLVKIDEDTSEPIIDKAVFGVWKDVNQNAELDEGTDVYIGEMTQTGTAGEYTTGDLEFGTYLVKETEAPKGYLADEDVYALSITKDGQTVTVGNYADPNGDVYLKEGKVKGNIQLTKVDAETREAISGAEFTVYTDNNANGVVDDGDTEYGKLAEVDTGIYRLAGVPYGNYVVKETKAAPLYRIDNGDYSVVVDANEKTFTVSNTDEMDVFIETSKRAGITLYKFDEEYPDNKLTGASFEVYKDTNLNGVIDEDDQFVGNLAEGTGDNEGIYSLSDLTLGQYLVRETEAPEGFEIDENTYVAVLSEDGEIFNVENEAGKGFLDTPILGAINLNKYDSRYPDHKISGAVFDVWKDVNSDGSVDDGDLYLGTLPEIEEGTYRLENLRVGDYIVHETEAPEGFNLDEGYYTVTISKNNREVEVINREGDGNFASGFYNDIKKGSVDIEKTDLTTSEGLPNTGIRLYDADMNIIADGRTDEKGHLVFSDLDYGTYYFQEFDAPEGYVIDESLFEFKITEDGVTKNEKMTNKPIEGDIIIKKTDISTGEALPETGIRIYDADKKVIFEGKTDENGYLEFDNLRYGTYYYQEYDAPEGYVIDETLHEFKILENGKVVMAEMTNRKITGSIIITKTDISTSETLPDTGIAIYTEDGKLVEKKYTDENGEVVFENLTYGKYYFIEFDAPDGYEINNEKHYFEVTKDGEILHDTMTDEKTPVPDTGNDNSVAIPVVAATASMLGLAAITIAVKARKKNED